MSSRAPTEQIIVPGGGGQGSGFASGAGGAFVSYHAFRDPIFPTLATFANPNYTESTEMTDYINHTKQSISRDKLIVEKQELERVTAIEQTDSWSEWFAQGPDEDGFCIYFEKVMENKTYRFCIMLSDGLWYMTGSRGLSGVGTDELIPRLVGLGIETNDVEVHTFGEVHSKAEELRNLTKKNPTKNRMKGKTL